MPFDFGDLIDPDGGSPADFPGEPDARSAGRPLSRRRPWFGLHEKRMRKAWEHDVFRYLALFAYVSVGALAIIGWATKNWWLFGCAIGAVILLRLTRLEYSYDEYVAEWRAANPDVASTPAIGELGTPVGDSRRSVGDSTRPAGGDSRTSVGDSTRPAGDSRTSAGGSHR